MFIFGELATLFIDSAFYWQLGVGILLLWSIYEIFNHFKKKEISIDIFFPYRIVNIVLSVMVNYKLQKKGNFNVMIANVLL